MIFRATKKIKAAPRVAYIHIGTEKTGTSSVQKFMLDNQRELSTNGLLYPIDCGYLSNFRLIWYATRNVDSHPMNNSVDLSDPIKRARWANRFEKKHKKEIKKFQAKHSSGSTVVYSSEHLQSRLVHPAELEKLRDFLQPLYDEIRVIVYLRRQDQLAISGYSTILRAGHTLPFELPAANRLSHYYSYVRLLDLWSSVFGQDNMIVRLYERSQLVEQDVVDDFGSIVGFQPDALDYSRISASNTSLSFSAQLALFKLNNIIAENLRLHPTILTKNSSQSMIGDWDALRKRFVTHVECIKDQHKADVINRQQAEEFYSIFKKDNDQIVESYGLPKGFDENFSKYPEKLNITVDDSEKESIACQIISSFLQAHEREIHPSLRQCLSDEVAPLQVAS